jgi:hypothetical protein
MLFIKALILTGVTVADKVPLTWKGINGYGVYATIGTPATDYFLTADFGITTTRLFAPGHMRAPYFPIPPPSTSRRDLGRRQGLGDVMSLGGVDLGPCPLELVADAPPGGPDNKNAVDSEGRLALGPESKIAKSKIIEISEGLVDFGGPRPRIASLLELHNAVPALSEGQTDLEAGIVGRDDGWFVRAQLMIGTTPGTTEPVQMALDAKIHDLYVPHASMHRLTVVMRLIAGDRNRDVYVDKGRLRLPCNSNGEFGFHPEITLRLESGAVLHIAHPTSIPVEQIELNPATHQLVCWTRFRINMDDAVQSFGPDGMPSITGGSWRINPNLIANLDSLFLDGKKMQVTFRRHEALASADDASSVVVERPAPTVPKFDTYTVSAETGSTTINFPAVPGATFGGFTLLTPKALRRGEGGYMFAFTRYSQETGIQATSNELPGLYEMASELVDFDFERNQLVVSILPASSQSTRPKFRVTIDRSENLMHVMLSHVSVPKTNNKKREEQVKKNLLNQYKEMGKGSY